jgi:adenosylcobinamide kinase / adenosylcobinamide-phosphate guanylyltransferase
MPSGFACNAAITGIVDVKELILGGVRSGKSRLAESRARQGLCEVVYLATASAADDAGLQHRIREHRERRPAHWQLVEEPIGLAAALRVHAAEHRCVLVECLTLWLTNLLCARDPAVLSRERVAFMETLPGLPGHIILVSNETGMGIVPIGELTRRFVDEAGRMHQELAQICDRVIFTVAGLPHFLKDRSA